MLHILKLKNNMTDLSVSRNKQIVIDFCESLRQKYLNKGKYKFTNGNNEVDIYVISPKY